MSGTRKIGFGSTKRANVEYATIDAARQGKSAAASVAVVA